MYFTNKLKPFLNNHKYKESEQFLKDKITVLNIIILFMVPTISLFAIFRLIEAQYIQAFVDSMLVVAIMFGHKLLAKDKKNIYITARIILLFAIITVLSVVIRMDTIDTRFTWVSLLIYLIYYLLGIKEGHKWFLGLMGILILSFTFHLINISLLSFIIFLIINTVLAFFLVQYENIKKQSEAYFLNNAKHLHLAVEEKTSELKEQKEMLELLFEKSYDGILLLENKKIIKCNEAIIKMLQYQSADELLNSHPSTLSPELQPDGSNSVEKSNEMIQICIENGSHNFEWVHKKANGENFWCDITLTYLHLKSGNIIHTVWREISDKKALEAENAKMYNNLESEVEKRTKELNVAMRAKGDFLANMSHEIRTPLNAILGFITLLRKDEKDKKRQKYFDIVHTSSHTLIRIINDILDFSKIENNKLEIENKEFNIVKAFEDVHLLFLEKAKEKNISLTLNINFNTPLYVLGDVIRVKQIISNLISNAIKFTKNRGKIKIDLSYKDSYLTCSIEDNGIGISQENLSNIFNSFSQADTSTTRKFGGTGLGLSISKHLVELMHGSISVSSEINKGTIFTFTIELKEVGSKVTNLPTNLKSMQEYHFNIESKILVVEDNKTNQMLMKMLLLDLDLECDIVENGLEALDRVKSKEYNIILMDENMPIMNGIEATKNIRELGFKSIPIVAVTANALKGDKEKFLAAGMNDYLSKPINTKEFKFILNKYLN